MSEKRRAYPTIKHEVSGCASCPLRATVVEDSAAYAEDGYETSHKCAHPEGHERDVTGEEGVPDCCPLLIAPLRLFVSAGERP